MGMKISPLPWYVTVWIKVAFEVLLFSMQRIPHISVRLTLAANGLLEPWNHVPSFKQRPSVLSEAS